MSLRQIPGPLNINCVSKYDFQTLSMHLIAQCQVGNVLYYIRSANYPSILVALQRGDLCGLFGKATTKEIPFLYGFILFIYFILPGLILCSASLGL